MKAVCLYYTRFKFQDEKSSFQAPIVNACKQANTAALE